METQNEEIQNKISEHLPRDCKIGQDFSQYFACFKCDSLHQSLLCFNFTIYI